MVSAPTKPDVEQQCVHLVDDDEALRDSLVWLTESQGFRVAAYESGEAFLAAWTPRMSGCLVLDVRMPGMSGLELYERLTDLHSTLPVIFITGHGDVPMAVSALKKGAVDFIEKPFNDKDMLRLIETCLELDREQRGKRLHAAEVKRLMSLLTQREKEVLDLIIAGKLNKQIADMLAISIKTVEVHRARVMEKMGARTLAQLVQRVLSIGGD